MTTVSLVFKWDSNPSHKYKRAFIFIFYFQLLTKIMAKNKPNASKNMNSKYIAFKNQIKDQKIIKITRKQT
jgi:hypothetical protein